MRIPAAATLAVLLATTAMAGSDASAAARSRVAMHASAHPHGVAHSHHLRHHHAIVHRADQAASAGDRHPAHPIIAHKAFGAPVWEPPPIPTPYPYDGKLAGDGVLHTGWLDSNVMRAFGVAID